MKKGMRAVAIGLAAVVGGLTLLVGGYVTYVATQYYRIADRQNLSVQKGAEQKVQVGEEYTVMTYNLGFGAYSPEYSFFMDTGVMKDGSEVVGKYAKGMSRADVQKNVDGQIGVMQRADADFYFCQETDEDADRSYHIDMLGSITKAMTGYGFTYAENFHTAMLFYPFSDPIGQSNSGLLTLSRYRTDSAVRRSFPVTDDFIDKLFDLDRCFSVHYLPVEGSEHSLVLINLHMSAYDKGGTIRAKQLTMLNEVLAEERAKGNYVIAGGDFNHCLIADAFPSDEEALDYFPSGQKTPDWVKNSVLHEKELAEGYSIVAPMNESTCRGADIPYEKGVNYSTVIDGFLLSDNVEAVRTETIDTQYAYSDHNPVSLQFKLK